MKKIFWMLLGAIVIFSGIIRTYELLKYPPSLFSDEVDGGYQAFVFNNCGNDYYGNKWPAHFHSFADWRSSFFVYAVALTQRFTGASELSVKLPVVIFGFLSTVVFGLIIYEVFKNRWLALLALGLFSINPWFLHYSRSGWEAMGMMWALFMGIYFWLRYLKAKKLSYLIVSLIFWVSSFYFYSTAKLLIVLLAIPVLMIWWEDIKKIQKNHIVAGVIIFGLLSVPMLVDTINGRSGYRFGYINIFSDPTIHDTVDQARFSDAQVMFEKGAIGVSPGWESKLEHNKFVLIESKFIRNYFQAFSTDFLLLKGDGNLRQGLGERGNFYFTDSVFLIFGLAAAVALVMDKNSKNSDRKINLFMIWFLVLSPIPYALTRDSNFPSGTRLLLMIIPMMFLIINGIEKIYQIIQLKPIIKGVFVGVSLFVIYSIQFGDFWHYYRIHYPQISARDWHYGIKEAVLAANNFNANKIYYSSTYQPILPFFYFYNQYLPSSGSCNPAKDTVWDNNQFFTGMQAENKFFFGFIDWPNLLANDIDWDNTIFVVPQEELIRIKSMSLKAETQILYEAEAKYTEETKMVIIKFRPEKPLKLTLADH